MKDTRSFMAKLVEKMLPGVVAGEIDTPENTVKFLAERAKVEDDPLPASIIKKCRVPAKIIDTCGKQSIILGDLDSADTVIFFIHGGAFIYEITPQHIQLADNLVKGSGACILAPIYPLCPNHTYRDAIDFLFNVYEKFIIPTGKKVLFMGDSAGGGLCVSMCKLMQQKGMALPEKLILLSPWVDIEMKECDYSDYQKVDPQLNAVTLRQIAEIWADGTDLKDVQLSPLFSDLSGLPETLLFTGTHEILHLDALRLEKKLTDSGVTVRMIIGEGMNHDYLLFPIREAKEAQKILIQELAH